MIIKEDDTVDDAASGRDSTAKSGLNIVSSFMAFIGGVPRGTAQ